MGFLCYRLIIPGIAYVDYAVLDRQYRGKGVVRMLLPYLIRYAKRQHIRVITGFVRADYNKSLKIFINWGFAPLYTNMDGTIIAMAINR